MSRWFRHYAGMMRDDKLVRVAIRSKQTIERVVWVWGAILESAAEVNSDGTYDADAAEIAYFLRADETDIQAVFDGLGSAGHIAAGAVVKWGDRQFKSDASKDRQAAYRERKKAAIGDTDNEVTSPSRHDDAPETDTELDTEEKPPVAPRKRVAAPHISFPSDWVIPEIASLSPKARACAEQWTRPSYETAHEAFELHWRNTRKRRPDWPGTWCVWIIREHSKVMRDQKFGNAPIEAKTRKPMNARELGSAIAWNRDNGNEVMAKHYETKLAELRGQPPPGPVGDLVKRVATGMGWRA